MDEGQHIPGFKPYIRTYKPLDLDWKVKRLFAVDVDKIQSYIDLNKCTLLLEEKEDINLPFLLIV